MCIIHGNHKSIGSSSPTSIDLLLLFYFVYSFSNVFIINLFVDAFLASANKLIAIYFFVLIHPIAVWWCLSKSERKRKRRKKYQFFNGCVFHYIYGEFILWFFFSALFRRFHYVYVCTMQMESVKEHCVYNFCVFFFSLLFILVTHISGKFISVPCCQIENQSESNGVQFEPNGKKRFVCGFFSLVFFFFWWIKRQWLTEQAHERCAAFFFLLLRIEFILFSGWQTIRVTT